VPQAVVAMIEAAGPTVRQLTEPLVEEATTAINTATKLLRRGTCQCDKALHPCLHVLCPSRSQRGLV
jgi:hypothetical protein